MSKRRAHLWVLALAGRLLLTGGLVFVLLLLCQPACSVVLNADRQQCQVTTDCRSSSSVDLVCSEGLCLAASSVARVQGKFSCRGVQPYTYPATVSVEILEFRRPGSSGAGSKGRPLSADVTLCRFRDRGCREPVEPSRPVDASGLLSLTLTEPDLYLELRPTGADAMIFQPQYVGPVDAIRTLITFGSTGVATMSIAPTEILSATAGFGGATFAADKANVVVTGFPCPDTDARGLEYRTDLAPISSRYYVGSSFPDFASQVTLRGPSDTQAVGGFINVESGVGRIVAIDPSTGEEVASIPAATMPGWTTYAYIDLRTRLR